MREPAATPTIRGKTERPLEGAFSLSGTDARAAREALERLLADGGPTLPGGFLDRVERFVELLLDANRRLNLTRITDPDEIARLHLLDAIAGLPYVDEARPERALDLGAGGGVPGLVLALARPEVHWVLLDSVRKKVDAMRSFAQALELTNVGFAADRAELAGRDPSHRERHDLVTARACASLPVLAEYALPLLRVGGRLLAWKGRLAAEELDAGARASKMLGGDSPAIRETGLPALGEHALVVIEKVVRTADRYPRRPGEPSRRPLA